MLDSLIIIEVCIFFVLGFLTIKDPVSIPISLYLPTFIRIVGVLISSSSLLLLFWVHGHLGKNFSPHILIRSHQQLIQDGPYRLIRHPMYTAFILLHLGVILAASNGIIAVSWSLGLIITLIYRIPREEKVLIAKFGEDYLDYRTKTGLLIPKLSRVKGIYKKIKIFRNKKEL